MNTSRVWPMRWMRPTRCSIRIGFHGRSKLTRVLANCRLRPSPPDSVQSMTGSGIAERRDGGVLLGGRFRRPENVTNACPSLTSSCCRCSSVRRKCGEHQQLVAAALPHQFQQPLVFRRAIDAAAPAR